MYCANDLKKYDIVHVSKYITNSVPMYCAHVLLTPSTLVKKTGRAELNATSRGPRKVRGTTPGNFR